MITKNFDAMQRTMMFGRIWPTGISSYSNLTETHYLQDDNTVVCVDYLNAPRYQSFAFPKGVSDSNNVYSALASLVVGEQTSADEVIAPENYYDYKLTHQIWSQSFGQTTANEIKYYTEGGVVYLHITHMFTNTGATRLVREIGLYIRVNMDSWGSSGTGMLIYRKVLPNYVEVATNGTFSVDLKIPLTSAAPNKPSA